MMGCGTKEPTIDLEAIERDVAALEAAKKAATPGVWCLGGWYGHCFKPDCPMFKPDCGEECRDDPCEQTYILSIKGDLSCCVSTTEDHSMLIGGDEDGAVLSLEDARFITLARNTPVEAHARTLIEEVRRLRRLLAETAEER